MVDELLERNKIWAEERIREDPEYFTRLTKLQSPEFLWIGCSDSRVPANVITGLAPGEVFVHRNVANLVHRADLNLLSVLQFAVDTLKVRHIIVCGHYGCGGVHAAVDGRPHGLIDHWLQPIRDVAETYNQELASHRDDLGRHNRLCELNVREQVSNVAKTPILGNAWAKGQNVTIHGWVYSLADGIIRDLKCSRSETSSS